MSGDFLQLMAESSRERVRLAKLERSEGQLLEIAAARPKAPVLERDPGGFDLFAELKLRSPAMGQLRTTDENVAKRVTDYARAGAAAVSVLTEPSRFDGSLTHLEQATAALTPLGIPAMRKDFLVDRYQVVEAHAAGASGVLVILRMLPPDELRELIACTLDLGLFALLEAFDEQDVELARQLVAEFQHRAYPHAPREAERGGRPGDAPPRKPTHLKDDSAQVAGEYSNTVKMPAPLLLVGVNCRDLATLQVVPARLEQLVDALPTAVPRVAESGVTSAEDAHRLADAGYDFALVGSALMQGGDPQALATALLAGGRSGVVDRLARERRGTSNAM